MTKYRDTLYANYYSTHAGKTQTDRQRVHFDQQVRYFKREFKALLPSTKSVSILDIGCGTGSLIKALNELGYSDTLGVDHSPEQVAMAHEFGVDTVQQISGEEALSSGKTYDVICAVDLIEHLTKDELVAFLANVRKALKPGGFVLFRTPNMDAPLASTFAFADFTHESFLNKSSALQLMTSCGFQDVEVLPSVMYIENPAKELLRRIGWAFLVLRLKMQLFFSARTWDKVVFTPNLVIKAKG